MTNFQKLKAEIERLEDTQFDSPLSEFVSVQVSVRQIEKRCEISPGSLSKALKRKQDSVSFDDKLGVLFES